MRGSGTSRPVPAWYWLVAAAALLFEAFGCFNYLAYVSISPERLATLPLDERVVVGATPPWITAAYAIAVWAGLFGAVLLLMRRRHAGLLLLVSLVAVVVQFGGVLLVPRLREILSPDTYTLPIVVVVIAYGFWHFARHAGKRGWLR